MSRDQSTQLGHGETLAFWILFLNLSLLTFWQKKSSDSATQKNFLIPDFRFFSKDLFVPRNTPNPSTLRTFCHQKSASKKLLTFSEKFYEHFKIILQHLWKLFGTHYPLKNFQILIYKTLTELEKVHFLRIFQNPQISFASKSTGVDQVLTKIFQIDPNLTFNVFHILNQDHISKIEKIFDGTEPPPKKAFFGGGLEA